MPTVHRFDFPAEFIRAVRRELGDGVGRLSDIQAERELLVRFAESVYLRYKMQVDAPVARAEFDDIIDQAQGDIEQASRGRKAAEEAVRARAHLDFKGV